MPFPRGSSWPRDWTQVSHIAGRLFTVWAAREAQLQEVTLYPGSQVKNDLFDEEKTSD